MSAAITNPRKSLRLRLACPVCLAWADLRWDSQTRDVSAGGCCVTAPRPLDRGEAIRVVLACPTTWRPVSVMATVAWCGGAEPWWMGLSFAKADQAETGAWFDEVTSSHLGQFHDTHDPVPDLLPLSARLVAGTPPGAVTLPAEHAALLRLAIQRPTLRVVVASMGSDWARSQRPLFTMLAKGWVRLEFQPATPPSEHAVRPATPAP